MFAVVSVAGCGTVRVVAAKKKSSDSKNTTSSGKKISWQDPKKYKSDAAITQKGQKAKGLSAPKSSDRFKSAAKTPVKKAGGFAGSGGSLAQGLGLSQPTKKSNVANAVLTATMLPGSGQAAKWAAGKVGQKVGQAAADSAWTVASKGLSTMSGGGKVGKAFTPMGPTLKSTRIMTAGQKAAAESGLYTRAANIAGAAGVGGAKAAAKITQKVVRGAVGTGKAGAAAVAAGKSLKPKKKK